MDTQYDIIIIGSGAGGGTLARHLAPSGKSILLLERGDWLPRELENWDADSVFVKNRYVSPDTWYDKDGKAFQPQVHYFVGGATKLYGAALYRQRKEDFGDQKLSDDLERAGYHPFHAPCGIMLNEDNRPFSACIRCSNVDGFPCLLHAKSDAEVIGVRPALEYPNVTLLTNARAIELHTNATGTTVTEVVVERNGEIETYQGGIVVVSAGATNSAKLLLISANDKHPNGLANGSDQVGRNYMFHNCTAVLAISKEPNPTQFQKTLALNDFYFGMEGFAYPVGNIQMVGKSQGPMFKGEKPVETKLAPMFTMTDIAHHAVDFWLSTEDLPDPNNRVSVDKEGKVTLSYTPNNEVPKQKLYDKLKSMLNHLGMHPDHLIPRSAYLKTDIPVAGVAHQAGTCRFGRDPKTSALDVNCKAHELDNLYVVDTSFFPSISAVNPALTAIANALRVGDHLLERMK
ncbi:MAG: GMC family oxidoreductase [Chloroflexi bacterium]|nr:MAG: GMC family oxidoreductase [Chloroflexota bacterium]